MHATIYHPCLSCIVNYDIAMDMIYSLGLHTLALCVCSLVIVVDNSIQYFVLVSFYIELDITFVYINLSFLGVCS